MEAPSTAFSSYDPEARALEGLLEIFGSTLSLKVIASAFCKAGGNPDLAAEILTKSQGCSSSTVSDVSNGELPNGSDKELKRASDVERGPSDGEQRGASDVELRCPSDGEQRGASDGELRSPSDGEQRGVSDGEQRGASSSELLSENVPNDLSCLDKNSKGSKQKNYPVSVGTVSSFLGKGYSRSTASLNGSLKTTKPLIINLNELPGDQFKCKDVVLGSTTRNDPVHDDLEDFLFKMLGDGFQLGKDVIRQVLGSCGYNATESIEKLVDLSASTLKKSDDIVEGYSGKSTSEDLKFEHRSNKAKSQNTNITQRNQAESVNRNRYDLQKEVFDSLFNVPERVEEIPRRPLVRAVKKIRSVGTVVCEPPRDPIPETSANVGPLEDVKYDDVAEDDESYLYLRRAAKENWLTMKEYYTAAADAFASGNHDRAYKFLEKGQHYNSKAREADEKSAQMTLECRTEEKEEKVLDLHGLDGKPALRLLKHHLATLSGIPGFQQLKVIVNTDDEEITKEARRRKPLVIKFLLSESIPWAQDESGKAILIPLNEINPQH